MKKLLLALVVIPMFGAGCATSSPPQPTPARPIYPTPAPTPMPKPAPTPAPTPNPYY